MVVTMAMGLALLACDKEQRQREATSAAGDKNQRQRAGEQTTTSAAAHAMFNCYKRPQHGNSERECSVRTLLMCLPTGTPGIPGSSPENCFKQDHAYCFYTGYDSGLQFSCLATSSECESWRKDQVPLAESSGRRMGPCLHLRPTDPSLQELVAP
jgi:hypothetical protein